MIICIKIPASHELHQLVVSCLKTCLFKSNDILALYYNNVVLFVEQKIVSPRTDKTEEENNTMRVKEKVKQIGLYFMMFCTDVGTYM